MHFGVGGFHRAHQAMYHDRLLNAGKGFEYGICGVGVMPQDRAMKDALDAQDHLYTLVVKHADGTYEPRVIGSIVDYLFAPDDPEAVVEKLAAETTRIVSLTVTEGGYEPDNVVFRHILDALALRRERGLAPFTVMSCDNLPGNGDRTRQVCLELARGERRRIDRRRVPERDGRPDHAADHRRRPRARSSERFGIDDAWPVVCEPFTQWVLEDAFTLGRPPYEDAGVQVVDDVEPYELMKLRLLNASHQALCYFAYLDGYRLVHEAAQDPLYRTFLRGYMDREGTPTLAPVPGVDLDDYKATLIERFSNPEVRDTVARLCAESSDRIPKWLLPVIRHNLEPRRRDRAQRRRRRQLGALRRGHGRAGRADRGRRPAQGPRHRQRPERRVPRGPRAVRRPRRRPPLQVAAFDEALDSLHEHGARTTLERYQSV